MATIDDPALAAEEQVRLLRELLGAERWAVVSTNPDLYKSWQQALVESAYEQRLWEYTNGKRDNGFKISTQEINDFLKSHAVGNEYAIPFDKQQPPARFATVKEAEDAGLGFTTKDGIPMIRRATVFQVDEDGYIYETLPPEGVRLTMRGDRGNIYSPARGPNDLKYIIHAALVDKAEKGFVDKAGKRVLEEDDIRNLAALDGLMVSGIRRYVLGRKADEDITRPGDNMAFYKRLLEIHNDPVKRAKEEAGLRDEILKAYELKEPEKPKDEKDEKAKLAYQKAREDYEKLKKQRDDLVNEQVESLMQLIERLGKLDDNQLAAAVDLAQMHRVTDLGWVGKLSPILAMGVGLFSGGEQPWQTADMTRGRLWDKYGLGDKVYGGFFGSHGGYDLAKAANLKISREELETAFEKEPEFLKILKKMDLPKTLDNKQFNQLTTALYTYEVLKHEGLLVGNAPTRIANMFKGEGGDLLISAERKAVLRSMGGLQVNNPPPLTPNTQFDMRLMAYTYKQNDDFLTGKSKDHPIIVQSRWFNNNFCIRQNIPGLGTGIETCLLEEQIVEHFMIQHSPRHLGFLPHQVHDPIPTGFLTTFKKDHPDKFKDVPEGTTFKQLTVEQVIAAVESMERRGTLEKQDRPLADIAREKMKVIAQTLTLEQFWGSGEANYKSKEHARIFLETQRAGTLAQVATHGEAPKPEEKASFSRNAEDIGGDQLAAADLSVPQGPQTQPKQSAM